jgi:hypothetical protein
MVKLLPGDPLDPWLSDLLDTWSRAKRVTDFDPPSPPPLTLTLTLTEAQPYT